MDYIDVLISYQKFILDENESKNKFFKDKSVLKNLMFFKGKLIHHKKKCNEVNCCCKNKYENVNDFIIDLLVRKFDITEDYDFLIYCLRFQTTSFMNNLYKFRSNLIMAFFKIKDLPTIFDLYEIITIFESILESFYFGKIDKKQAKTLSKISEIFDNYIKSKQNFSDLLFSILNPYLILEKKNDYLLLINEIEKTFDIKDSIWKYLEEKSVKLVSDKIFDFNKKALKQRKKVDKIVGKFENKYKKNQSFYYLALSVYYQNMNNEPEKAKKYFEKYTNLIKKMQYYIQFHSGELNPDNLTLSSVVIQSSMDQSKIGEILDITPDFREYLGIEPSPIIGMNINELILEDYREKHQILMSNSNKLWSVLNETSEFIIQDFNGNIKKVTFLIKAFYSIKNNSTTIIYLKFHDLNSWCLLQLDPSLKFKASDEVFFKMLLDYYENSWIKDISQISTSLARDIDYYFNYDPKKKNIISVKDALKRDEVLEQLKFVGKKYIVNIDSPFYKKMKDIPFTAKVKPIEFMGNEKIYLVEIKFEYNFIQKYKIAEDEISNITDESELDSSEDYNINQNQNFIEGSNSKMSFFKKNNFSKSFKKKGKIQETKQIHKQSKKFI